MEPARRGLVKEVIGVQRARSSGHVWIKGKDWGFDSGLQIENHPSHLLS